MYHGVGLSLDYIHRMLNGMITQQRTDYQNHLAFEGILSHLQNNLLLLERSFFTKLKRVS
jgi:hypothetical protein